MRKALVVIVLPLILIITVRTYACASSKDEGVFTYLQNQIHELVQEIKELKNENQQLREKIKELEKEKEKKYSTGYNDGIVASYSYEFVTYGSYYCTDQNQISVYLEVEENKKSSGEVVSFVGSRQAVLDVSIDIPKGYRGIVRGTDDYKPLSPGEYRLNLTGMACIVRESSFNKWWNYFDSTPIAH